MGRQGSLCRVIRSLSVLRQQPGAATNLSHSNVRCFASLPAETADEPAVNAKEGKVCIAICLSDQGA